MQAEHLNPLVPRVTYLLHELLEATNSKKNVCFVFFPQCWTSATLKCYF